MSLCIRENKLPVFYVRVSVHHKILSIIVQRDATISSLFIYCKVTLHVSGVVAPINRSTWCGRKVMRLATLCTNQQRCCLPLHMAVRLTPAVDSVEV